MQIAPQDRESLVCLDLPLLLGRPRPQPLRSAGGIGTPDGALF